jgi:hypothetical protein
MIIILLIPIFDVIQQKEVGENDDVCPVKVIETADLDADWAAEEGVPNGMVSPHILLSFWQRLAAF